MYAAAIEQPELCAMHQAVLASPSAITHITWKKAARSSSAPPKERGRSMRDICASCSASSTSAGSPRAASMRGAAASSRGANARARAIQS